MDKSKILTEMGYPDWEYDFAGRLRCPCGNICDEDGGAPCGCTSPLKENALI